ncbi:hypothetical protein EDC25_10853 [Pseudofulvimonas gallinarii]|uniref:DUF1566 domain-containing protein n=1 Tax=Pseudofulvimonas gallinarii TaxID=634155 RepID=A0A4R3LEK2_9GAMM|nr:hypothetical protein EDC25_10853 [Pseudofulvimonas gallinarii]
MGRCILGGVMALFSLMVGGAMAQDRDRWQLAASGVVEDVLSGLQWTQNGTYRIGAFDHKNWNLARNYCARLTLEGGGWELPSVDQLSELYVGAGDSRVPCRGRRTCVVPGHFNIGWDEIWADETRVSYGTRRWNHAAKYNLSSGRYGGKSGWGVIGHSWAEVLCVRPTPGGVVAMKRERERAQRQAFIEQVEQERLERERVRLDVELPLLTSRGTRICKVVAPYTFTGYVDDVSEDRARIRILVNSVADAHGIVPGSPSPEVIWDRPSNWRVCE